MIIQFLEFTFQSFWHFVGVWALVGAFGFAIGQPFRMFGAALSKPGPMGPAGMPGPTGATGMQGRDGMDGKDCVCVGKN